MTVSWERVAHILEREDVSDTVLAERLGCTAEFVSGVRRDLRLPSYEQPEPTIRLAAPLTVGDRDRFLDNSQVTADGHRVWTGRCHSRDGTPLFRSGVTAYRIAFRLEHEEEPLGPVRVECVMPFCVEGLHLSDQLMREQAAAAGGAS